MQLIGTSQSPQVGHPSVSLHLEEPKCTAQCAGSISVSAEASSSSKSASSLPSRPPRGGRCCAAGRLSLRLTLSLLCTVLIWLACLLVYLIGERSTASLVGHLSARQRQSTLAQVGGVVEFELYKSVRTVAMLSDLLQTRFNGRFAGPVSNTTGFLADSDRLLRTFANGYQQLLGYGTIEGSYAHVFNEFAGNTSGSVFGLEAHQNREAAKRG